MESDHAFVFRAFDAFSFGKPDFTPPENAMAE
jgi:hypothetical protein